VNKTEVTPEGWVVTDLKTFRMIADHPPPRPYSYLHQLWVDARSRRPLTLWAYGIGVIAVAVALGWWLLLPVGGALLALYVMMLRSAVRHFRAAPAAVGVVEALTPHPKMGDFLTGIAITSDGREVLVALPAQLTDGIIGGGRRAEIFFLYDSQPGNYSLGFGARAMPGKEHG
jgi:hypothetical protein